MKNSLKTERKELKLLKAKAFLVQKGFGFLC